ncbi:MAG: UDP-N-acetylmuramoyl-tripeptide--D-alanyl-D-alanine ligase [Acidimicrobiales bacterium]
MRWTAAEIADIVGGVITQGDPATVVEMVTQDSREIDSSGDTSAIPALFVPLVAERDGHDFVASSGAAATLSSRPVSDLPGLAGLSDRMVVIEVDDTARALSELGSAGRARLGGHPVIGITGSVGKTTTKDFLAAILGADRPTHASHRSFNNELGVPLTILNAPDDTEALVLEMGARGIGHIAGLCAVGRPTVGIVTVVGAAHTSEFGSVEAIAVGKGELVEALPSAADGGVAVLNAANPLVMGMAARTSARIVTFGPGGDVRAESVVLDDELVPTFTLVASGPIEPAVRTEVTLGARGVHLVDNALAAAAAALAIGVPAAAVVAGLAQPVLSPMRMALVRTERGTRVLDDSYNANPMSTEAALRSLASLALAPGGRRFAVLGEMAELGDIAAGEHARMGRIAADLGIHVVAVNAPDYLAGLAGAAAGVDGAAAADLVAGIPEALRLLTDPPMGAPIGPDDAVLVKGSRVAGLERLVALLTA